MTKPSSLIYSPVSPTPPAQISLWFFSFWLSHATQYVGVYGSLAPSSQFPNQD